MVERIVGVQVFDFLRYEVYRDKMLPILQSYGGKFRVDIRVSDVLLSPSGSPFNRMFVIQFPSFIALDEFFADDEYLAVRDGYFYSSVSHSHQLACYQVTHHNLPARKDHEIY